MKQVTIITVAAMLLVGASARAGVVLRLDASAITGLNNGDSVTAWADTSGTGNDATGLVGGNGTGLTYVTGALNGLAAVRFDGICHFSIFQALSRH